MKKVALLLLLGTLVAASSFAAPTASLSLQGRVTSTIRLMVTARSAGNPLNLPGSQANLAIATVSGKDNGFTVTVQRANAGESEPRYSRTAGGSSDTLLYAAEYSEEPVNFVPGTATITNLSGTMNGSGAAGTVSIRHSVAIANPVAGRYSETLIITITAK